MSFHSLSAEDTRNLEAQRAGEMLYNHSSAGSSIRSVNSVHSVSSIHGVHHQEGGGGHYLNLPPHSLHHQDGGHFLNPQNVGSYQRQQQSGPPAFGSYQNHAPPNLGPYHQSGPPGMNQYPGPPQYQQSAPQSMPQYQRQQDSYQQGAPFQQNVPYQQGAPHQQNAPYQQNVPHQQNASYQQNAPHQQNAPYQQGAPHHVHFQPNMSGARPNVSHLRTVSYTTGSNSGGNVFPVIMTDDLVSGTQHNNRMSPVRRFFCLLMTFDVLFTALLWIISILVTERDLIKQMKAQVMNYTIASSMFDCVMVSAIRFLMCISGYAILDISHWWVVATSTSGSVAFVVAKVFKYEWTTNNPITYDVMLVLVSFIIAWAEAWMMDFRVLPLEQKAKEIWGPYLENNERTPLLSAPAETGGMLQRYIEGSTLYEGSVGNFYSPMETPDVSDDECDDTSTDSGIRIPGKFRRKRNKALTTQEAEYKKMAEEVLQNAWRTLNSDDWKLEKKLDNGDTVHVKTVKGKKLFKLAGFVDIAPALLLEDLFYRGDLIPSWNPTLADSKTVQPIDEYTDISYQVCAEAGGGVVSTRDFVNIRHWAQVDGVYVSAGKSVAHPAMPPQKQKVRGENGPGCFAMRPAGPAGDKCLFQWLLDTDLKGWIPQAIIDKALTGAQLDYIANVRRRAVSLQEAQRHNSSIGSAQDIAFTD